MLVCFFLLIGGTKRRKNRKTSAINRTKIKELNETPHKTLSTEEESSKQKGCHATAFLVLECVCDAAYQNCSNLEKKKLPSISALASLSDP